ncbi:hypothetical protein DFAR_3320009 [Desulfarculales bacterium]
MRQIINWRNFTSLPKVTFGKHQEEKTMDGFLRHTPRSRTPLRGQKPRDLLIAANPPGVDLLATASTLGR